MITWMAGVMSHCSSGCCCCHGNLMTWLTSAMSSMKMMRYSHQCVHGIIGCYLITNNAGLVFSLPNFPRLPCPIPFHLLHPFYISVSVDVSTPSSSLPTLLSWLMQAVVKVYSKSNGNGQNCSVLLQTCSFVSKWLMMLVISTSQHLSASFQNSCSVWSLGCN